MLVGDIEKEMLKALDPLSIKASSVFRDEMMNIVSKRSEGWRNVSMILRRQRY